MIIVFNTGDEMEITKEQAQLIFQVSTTNAKRIELNGELISLSHIARIKEGGIKPQIDMSSQEDKAMYFPERKPYTSPMQKAMKQKRSLEQMIKGFKKTSQSGATLDKMELKLSLLNK